MDDATALRLKKIDIGLCSAERSASIETQVRIAVLAVGLTFGAGAGLAGLAGQVPMPAAAVGLATGAAVVIAQVRGVRLVAVRLDAAHRQALEDIDSLMPSGGDNEDDGQGDPDA